MRARHLTVLCAVAALAFGLGVPAQATLEDYIKSPTPEFQWSKVSETQAGNVKIITLKMCSQTWRDIPWNHAIEIYVPEKVTHGKTAMLLVTGGNPGPASTLLAASVAPRLEAPMAVLYNIPNQPLFDGKLEDDLIAHTFQQYFETGDASWPLLFPMVKSAVRAMDALQAYSAEAMGQPFENFVITGASKRGWTTYLTGASDPRVRAIAPMVFDNLAFDRQMPRQLELWGRYSAQIDDYTRRGLQQLMETPRGKQLVSMVDPWFYRERLSMPKLLVHGANDPYWSTDSTRLYWRDLMGDKYLLTVPNGGHGLDDFGRVINTMAAFFHTVATDQKLPNLRARQTLQDGRIRLALRSNVAPKEVRVWTARATDLDFRPVRWESQVVPSNRLTRGERGGYTGSIDVPRGEGGLAVFVEGEYEVNGHSFTVSTPSRVYGQRPGAVTDAAAPN
jgi:PhoPQ-activated pathogenicity-related protein